MQEQKGRFKDPVAQALHDLRLRTSETPAQEVTRYHEAAQQPMTLKDLMKEFRSLPYVYKPDSQEVDYVATWYALKERRLALEALFSPEIVTILFQVLEEGETGLRWANSGYQREVKLGSEVTTAQLERISDGQIARELARLTQDLWLWALQTWESRMHAVVGSEGLFENPSLYKVGFYGLAKISDFYSEQEEVAIEERKARFSRETEDNDEAEGETELWHAEVKSPWMMFENGATHGNREIWRFLDLVSRMAPNLSAEEVTELARNSYPTLAYLATFHETFSEPLATFLSVTPGAWELDPNRFEITDRGGKLRVVVRHQTWADFLNRFRSSVDDAPTAYTVPNYAAEGKGATLGCPLFQAPSMQELHDAAKGETGARSIATPIALFERYLEIAAKHIYQRRHSSK